MRLRLFLIVWISIMLSSCTDKELTVKDAWARTGITGENSAVYMIIDNPTKVDDVLLSAASDVADNVELHMSSMDDQGTMSMQQQEGISVANRTSVELKPGGFHIMLIGLKQDLAAGTTLQLTLTFKNAGEITFEVPIKSP
jgi:hypothetical protein